MAVYHEVNDFPLSKAPANRGPPLREMTMEQLQSMDTARSPPIICIPLPLKDRH